MVYSTKSKILVHEVLLISLTQMKDNLEKKVGTLLMFDIAISVTAVMSDYPADTQKVLRSLVKISRFER